MKYLFEQLRIFLFGKEQNTAKRIVNWALILLIIAGFTEYGIDHDGDMSGLLKKETWETKPSTNYQDTLPTINDTIYVRALGEVNYSELQRASNILKEKFNRETRIISPIEVTNDMLYQGSNIIDPYSTVKSTNESYNTLTITEYDMTDSDLITSVMGMYYDKNILVGTGGSFEETIIHEFGHFLGLPHCENPKCVMTTRDKTGGEKPPTYFCKNCKSKINI